MDRNGANRKWRLNSKQKWMQFQHMCNKSVLLLAMDLECEYKKSVAMAGVNRQQHQ